MQTNDVRFRLGRTGPRFHLQPKTFLGKVLTVVVGALMLIAVFVFSLLIFAVVAAGGLLVVGYVWWKTRKLRRQMRENPPGGRIIEGEVIRDVESHDTVQR